MTSITDDSRDRIELFLKYGQAIIPDREEQIETICDLVPTSSASDRIIELGCGEGLLTRALLDRFVDCKVRGMDASRHMVGYVQSHLAHYGSRVEVLHGDMADGGWRTGTEKARAIVSCLAIGALDHGRQRLLLAEMAEALAAGGVVVIADMVKAPAPAGAALAARRWAQTVHKQSLNLLGTSEAYDYFCQSKGPFYLNDSRGSPASLYEQLRWLQDVGLIEVDVYWMRAGHAIFGGYKP